MVDILTKRKTRGRALKPREKETLRWCCESAPQTRTVRTRLRKYWRAQISAASGWRMRFVQTFQRHHSPFSSMTALKLWVFYQGVCVWVVSSVNWDVRWKTPFTYFHVIYAFIILLHVSLLNKFLKITVRLFSRKFKFGYYVSECYSIHMNAR